MSTSTHPPIPPDLPEGAATSQPPEKKQGKRALRVTCPHCGTKAPTCHAVRVSETLERWDAVCPNADCAAVFFGSTAIEGERRPSLKPNPAVRLPLGNRRHATTKQEPQ